MKKFVSLALCLAMVFSVLPMGSLKLHADVVNPEIIWLEKYYDRVDLFSEGLAKVIVDDHGIENLNFIDKTGRELITPKYIQAKDFSEGLAAVRVGDYATGKWGFIDRTGKEVIPPKYDETEGFKEGLAPVKLNKKWGFIDRTGKEVIPPKYDKAEGFKKDLAPVELNGKWGLIDKTGREVIAPQYSSDLDLEIDSFRGNEDLLKVKVTSDNLDGKYGLFNKTSREWIAPKYDQVEAFSEGMAVVVVGDYESGEWGFIDKNGREVIPLKYDSVRDFKEGLARVKLNKKWGFIDKTGKEVIPFKYDWGRDFSEGFAAVYLNKKWGFIDKTGKEVIAPKYDDALYFFEGLAWVAVVDGETQKWGFIDKRGREVTPIKYGFSYRDSDNFKTMGFAPAALNGKWGFIDKTGREIIPFKYDQVYWKNANFLDRYTEDISFIEAYEGETNKIGWIDMENKIIIAPKYDSIFDGYGRKIQLDRRSYLSEGLIPVGLNGKFGYVDKTGREVISLKYDWAGLFSEGLAAVRVGDMKTGKYGFIDKTGREVIAPKYDNISSFSEGLACVKLNGKWGIMKNPLAKASVKTQAPANNDITAKYSISKLSIDGVAANGMEIYNIANNNYFKLRDVAKLLNDTDKKFSVNWNNEKKLISLVSGQNYVATGTELSGGDGKDKSAVLSNAKMELNGKEVKLKAYTIGGNNYFKLRDLCEVLDVKVDWDQATQTILLKTE